MTRGVSHHTSRPGDFGGNSLKVIRQQPPFLKGMLALRPAPISRAASSPKSGSWPTTRTRRRLERLARKVINASGSPPGRRASQKSKGGLELSASAYNLRGLHGAHQRAGDNPIRFQSRANQPGGDLAHLLLTLGGKRPLGIVHHGGGAAHHGDAVPHDVELIVRRASCPALISFLGRHRLSYESSRPAPDHKASNSRV